LLFQESLEIASEDFNWIAGIPRSIVLGEKKRLKFRSRHTQRFGQCEVSIAQLTGKIHIRFEDKQRALTPGQILALYDDDECLGAAKIPAAFI
jgi:tRNA-specific 2-thiouridylase